MINDPKINKTVLAPTINKAPELTDEIVNLQLQNYYLATSKKGIEIHKKNNCDEPPQKPVLISVLPKLFQSVFSGLIDEHFNDYNTQIINHKGSLWSDNIIFSHLNSITSTQQLPDILITYDYNCIYEKGFLNRFYDQERFSTSSYYHARQDQYRDYAKIIKVLAYDQFVMVVQKKGFNTYAKPREWYELLNPLLEQKIIVPGMRDYFCNSYYLPYIKRFGQKSVEYLNKNIANRMHPEEMTTLIEQNLNPEVTVFIMPYSYAQSIKNTLDFEIVLPDDNEMAIPIQMLIKKEAHTKHKRLLKFLTSEELGNEFIKAGYFSTHPNLQNKFSSLIDWEFVSTIQSNTI